MIWQYCQSAAGRIPVYLEKKMQVQTYFKRAVLPVSLLALVGTANAAIDVTAATTGISDAQTAVLAVLAAMITMAAAIFGVKKVLRLLGR